ncbi:MAG: ABC transporter permease [Planctomycetota bacterium]|nr:ABC transporter permease [Planctomycetota bacterium]
MASDYTFFFVMLSFCGIMLLVTFVYVLRRAFARDAGEIGGWELRGAWGRVTAVARITLAEGIRTKIAAGFTGLVLIAIPLFLVICTGDGTISGEVKMFLAYSLGFASFWLALLTIFFSCRSLSMEVAQRQIYGVVSKPIPRWQILVGKWTGVMILNVSLLAVVCLATYGGHRYKLWRFKADLAHELHTFGGLTPADANAAVAALDSVEGKGVKGQGSPVVSTLAKALGQTNDQISEKLLMLPEATRVNLRRFDELRRQVLTARATLTPPEIPDLPDLVDEQYAAMEKESRLPAGWTVRETKLRIKAAIKASYMTVPFRMGRTWTMKGGPPPSEERDFLMSVRFKIRPSSYLDSVSEFDLERDTLLAEWGVGNPTPDPPPYFSLLAAHPVNTFNEFEIETESVAEDGAVILSFMNIDPRRVSAAFDFPFGLQVLYRVGSFEMNVFQVYLAILIPLACLGAVGVCASTFLSFPVGSLIVIVIYIISLCIGFVAESLGITEDYYDPEHITWAIQLRQGIVNSMDWAFAIGDCEPVTNLIEGRAIGWSRLWTLTWKFVLLKGLLTLTLAVMIFRRRELAAVTV